jgi:predicted dehydrogenase
MPEPLRVGLAGAGAMGRNHARLLADLDGVELAAVWDRDPEAAAAVARLYGVPAAASWQELADRSEAAVVAVPTAVHAELGCALLDRGLHLLVEKPMAASLAEADVLLAAATGASARRPAGGRREPVVAVGHVEFFNPAVQALLAAGGRPRFVEVQRLSVFTPRSLDVDVVLDLMIHDLQILHALDPSPVAEVRATGIEVLSGRVDIANARVALESGAVANLTASRVSAERVRKLRAFLPNRYYSLDYREQEIKGYRLVREPGGEGSCEARRIVPDDLPVERQEPLRAELAAFAAACRGEAAALVGGAEGRQALATALAVTAAIAGGG